MLRAVPLIVLGLFFAVAVVWRSAYHRRHFAGSGVVIFSGKSPGEILFDLGALVVPILLLGQAVAWWLQPGLLGPLACGGTSSTWELIVGAAAALASLVLIVVAQLQMGASWRIGIERGAKPGLITHGLYAYSRNPIYAAVDLALAGAVFLIPTWLSAAIALGTWIGIAFQVRREEAYLSDAYGSAFADYARQVGRFVPYLRSS